MYSFKGRVAVVTGAAEGIGAAIARALWAHGADLAVVDIKPVDIARITADRGTRDQRIFGYECDATSSAQVSQICAALQADLGPASILVNNVGGGGKDAGDDVETMSDEQWEFVLSLSLSSVMRFCRGLVGGMKAARYGRIVNISSSLKDGVYGPVGTVKGRLPYVTAKMAVVGLTQQLANDLGPFAISVNAVSPGLTLPGDDARITQRYRALSPEEQARLRAHIPLGRLADGADIANAVCFLAAEQSGYVSGQTITVAGGGYR
ncbi:beta-ketoacyl-ACP reductase [Mesorhizobium sp. L-8-10]|uniref:SDR family NAD(P)-dependent oxidoreductase n=1 Tax=Mesorhizobium sp. L-8-10 TaxID=2744523 RepID=UPI001928ACC4|nr:SDR family oxidoreductase [Mesorhizobium sp. L-8-10]BCH29334.1 beta-ketoacyl-ACP reductase [Mesorhizobium sp. L-8-10]